MSLQCRHCDYGNKENAKFCAGCGSALQSALQETKMDIGTATKSNDGLEEGSPTFLGKRLEGLDKTEKAPSDTAPREKNKDGDKATTFTAETEEMPEVVTCSGCGRRLSTTVKVRPIKIKCKACGSTTILTRDRPAVEGERKAGEVPVAREPDIGRPLQPPAQPQIPSPQSQQTQYYPQHYYPPPQQPYQQPYHQPYPAYQQYPPHPQYPVHPAPPSPHPPQAPQALMHRDEVYDPETERAGISRIYSAVRKRRVTDIIVSPRWVVLLIVAPILIMIISTLYMGVMLGIQDTGAPSGSSPGLDASALILFIIFAVAPILQAVLAGYIFYKLLKRRNAHFERDKELREGIILYLQGKAAKSKSVWNYLDVDYLRRMEYSGRVLDLKRPVELLVLLLVLTNVIPGVVAAILPFALYDTYILLFLILLVILGFMGIVVLFYLLYRLTMDFQRHSQRQYFFSQQAADIIYRSTGRPIHVVKSVPERSIVVYTVLLIITLGLFGFFWLYLLIKDPNEHFQNQWYFEDQLVFALKGDGLFTQGDGLPTQGDSS